MATSTPVSKSATVNPAGWLALLVCLISDWGARAMASLLAARVKQADRLFNL
jgi:hypothetical protein